MDERQLRTALAVAQLGSMTKAADRLYTSVQGVRGQIDSFEAEVGCQLFKRSNRGVAPTPAGEVLLRDAPALLDRMARLAHDMREAGSSSSHEVRVSIWAGKEIPVVDAICARLAALDPAMTVSFVPLEASRLYADVAEGVADVGFFTKSDAKALAARGVEATSVGIWMGYRVVMSPDNPLASPEGDPLEPAELLNCPAAMAVGVTRDEAQPPLALGGLDPVSYDRYEILTYCSRGGVCVCDEYLAGTLPSLASRPLAAPKVEIVVGHRPDPSPAVLLFLETARQVAADWGRDA